MKADSKLAKKIESGDFIVTAECAPGATATGATTEAALKFLDGKLAAVNFPDNSHGVAISSVAAAVAAIKLGAEPILQMVTRDRNRIALQSDLLGAASLGIKNLLCMSGYHQMLIGCPESANVFDVDSSQFVDLATRMSETGVLADGTKFDGQFSMLVGAVANPFLRPLDLNLFRLGIKIDAGAKFIQTHAVFDLEAFSQWLDAARKEGLTKKVAILAGVFPLASAAEAQKLRDTYAEFRIPDKVIERLKKAGDDAAQKKEGIAICAETIKQLKALEGLRGIHILSGGKEAIGAGNSGRRRTYNYREKLMPEKYHIKTQPVPPRLPRIGKHGVVDWREDCARCHNCVKKACVYDRYRQEADYIRNLHDVDALFFECMGCFSCVQNCTKGILCLSINPAYEKLGNKYWKPDIIKTTWLQAETAKIPVSGAGYRGPFSGHGFDSMWTDMSEIVRPTRDGIHGREYISTSVDIGRKPSYLSLNGTKSLANLPPLVSIPHAVDHRFEFAGAHPAEAGRGDRTDRRRHRLDRHHGFALPARERSQPEKYRVLPGPGQPAGAGCDPEKDPAGGNCRQPGGGGAHQGNQKKSIRKSWSPSAWN